MIYLGLFENLLIRSMQYYIGKINLASINVAVVLLRFLAFRFSLRDMFLQGYNIRQAFSYCKCQVL